MTDDLHTVDSEQTTQLKVANAFLIGETPEKISEDFDIPLEQVKYILADDKTQKYITTTSGNEELQMNLKRIRRATGLQDTIIDKLEEFLNNDAIPVYMWKDSHVTLLKDVLLKQLPNTISKTIGLAISMNFGKWQWPVSNVDETLQWVLKRLTPWQVILFREILDGIGDAFLQGKTDVINQVNNILKWVQVINAEEV